MPRKNKNVRPKKDKKKKPGVFKKPGGKKKLPPAQDTCCHD